MKASELVKRLNELILKHGDWLIVVRDHVEGNDLESSQVVVEPSFDQGYIIDPETKQKQIIMSENAFVIE